MHTRSLLAAACSAVLLGLVAGTIHAAPIIHQPISQKSPAVAQSPAEQSITNGRVALERNDPRVAATHFEKVLTGEPKHLGALLGMVEAAVRQGNASLADTYLQRAQQAAPLSAEVKIAMARVDYARNEVDRAIKHLEAAVALDGNFLAAWLDLGEAQFTAGRAKDAENAFRRATSLDAKRASAHFGLGRALVAQGNRPAALKAFEQATRLEPQRPQPWIAIAEVHAADKRWTDAHRAVAEARKAAPQDRLPSIALANLLALSGKRAEAATEYASVAARFTDWPEPLLRLSALHQQDGNTAAAETARRAAAARSEALVARR